MEIPDQASSVGERAVGPGRQIGGHTRSKRPATSRIHQEIPEGFLYDSNGDNFVTTLPGNFV